MLNLNSRLCDVSGLISLFLIAISLKEKERLYMNYHLNRYI